MATILLVNKFDKPTFLNNYKREDVRCFLYNSSLYYATSDGKIWSGTRHKPLSLSIQNNGYVSFRKTTCHRVIAYCFGLITDFNSELDIDHIDNNKQNNAVSNLRAVSHQFNTTVREDFIHRRRPILVYKYKTHDYVAKYDSLKSCSEDLDITQPIICNILKKKRIQAKGYVFFYEGEEIVFGIPLKRGIKTKVIARKDGIEKSYDSISDAAKDLGIAPEQISNIFKGLGKTAHGWTFEKVE